jgi:hypothetical protein
MKNSLLFPPTWHPSQPYLNLPSLTGFLVQDGVTTVAEHNLGIEILNGVASQFYEAGLYQEIESDGCIEYTVIGDPIKLSSRLCGAASKARCSSRHSSVQRSVSCVEPLPFMELKGKSQEPPVFRVKR